MKALFHDLGLIEKFRTGRQRFELDGADEARAFLTARGIPADRARLISEGIALHTTPEIPHPMAPEVALVTAGVDLDVLGIGYDTLPPETREAVAAAHPSPTSSAASPTPSTPAWPTAPGPPSAM
ncbi:hypothetical protein [Streptomyces decoyicus]|uniref:hypothetical protein n=1 Tax=Streptomyces decoyicus TaxID=249567 RepID=UPI00386BDD1E